MPISDRYDERDNLMKTRLTALASSALLTAVALTGCSTGAADSNAGGMSGMEHGSSAGSSPTSEHNQADVAFATAMIPHHQQAVEMADLVLAKQGVDVRVADLARTVTAAQQPEIDTMKGWLAQWGEEDHSGMSGMDMGHGMMSQDDMDALRGASGSDASALFLSQMIQHHEGAIAMARTEADTGRAAAAVALAKGIVKAQAAEIATMKELRASLAAS